MAYPRSKSVDLFDTWAVLAKYIYGLLDTNFVFYIMITQQDYI
jgi:hypothetical protein